MIEVFGSRLLRVRVAARGLAIGGLIKSIRVQLGMSAVPPKNWTVE
jgi:hypothetical protein